jgi:Zn-dependent membrane protease YugP
MLVTQWYVSSSYKKWSQVPNRNRLSGSDAAQRLIRNGGLNDVRVEGVAGNLTDHYDPRQKVLRLSQGVYQGQSVAAVAIAAHELGRFAGPQITFR